MIAPTTADAIRAACEHAGHCVITEGTLQPGLVLGRLLQALAALESSAALPLIARVQAIPAAAREDHDHPYWDTDEPAQLLADVTIALDAVAPEGFSFCSEGEWQRLGFFRG